MYCMESLFSVLCKHFIDVTYFPWWMSVSLDVGVEPLGLEWASEAQRWFQSQVDGELLTARVLSVSERGYEVKLEIRGQDVAAALISQQLAKAPGAIPKMPCVSSEPKHQEKIQESQLNQVQVPGQSGSISKEIPKEGPAAQSDMQLECRCSKLKHLITQPHWNCVLWSCFSPIFPSGLENSRAASQRDL